MNRQPVLFISHGAPTFALEPGRAGPLLTQLGRELPPPKAVVVVSPHWMTRGFAVTTSRQPETIHDFGGFPAALYTLGYPAPGEPAVAARVAQLLGAAGVPVALNDHRGLDHGAWVPLMHLFPQADVPVLQVSMPAGLDTQSAWQLGRVLAPLRDEGVLIVGSGSLTHNLYEFRTGETAEAAYAREFQQWARDAVQRHDRAALEGYLERAPHARRAHPTPDHYLPLLVAVGASAAGETVRVLEGGIEHGVLSMESYLLGAEQ